MKSKQLETGLPKNWWKFLEAKKKRRTGCWCKEDLKLLIKDVGIGNNFLMLPPYDVAIALKLISDMNGKDFDDLCEGLGSMCPDIATEAQLVVAALEHYTEEEIVKMVEIIIKHINKCQKARSRI